MNKQMSNQINGSMKSEFITYCVAKFLYNKQHVSVFTVAKMSSQMQNQGIYLHKEIHK